MWFCLVDGGDWLKISLISKPRKQTRYVEMILGHGGREFVCDCKSIKHEESPQSTRNTALNYFLRPSLSLKLINISSKVYSVMGN